MLQLQAKVAEFFDQRFRVAREDDERVHGRIIRTKVLFAQHRPNYAQNCVGTADLLRRRFRPPIAAPIGIETRRIMLGVTRLLGPIEKAGRSNCPLLGVGHRSR